MSKDTIFNTDRKEFKASTKEEPLRLLPKYPTSSYYLSYPLPFIDCREHIRLLQDELVQEGDEFYFENKWHVASEARCGSFVGNTFIYRRARGKIPLIEKFLALKKKKK